MPSVPRPEYPRPQFVRKEWLNLNGTWEFEFDPGVSGDSRELYEQKKFSKKILVPFCMESRLSGIGHIDFMPCVWYRKNVRLPALWKGKRVLLHFGAVDYIAKVWVNGKPAGTHRGGSVSFHFDITHLLCIGNNSIAVQAIDDTRGKLQPLGKQSDWYESHGCSYTRTTGIWQTVWLEAVPHTYMVSCNMFANIRQGSISVHMKIAGNTAGCSLEALALASGVPAGNTRIEAQGHCSFNINIKNPRLWSINDPYLYSLQFRLVRQGKVIDSVESYMGLREVRIEGKKVLVNGKPVFQRLVLDQGFYPNGIWTAPSDAALRRDIELSQAMGFNGARLHQKVFEPRYLYWADKLGYLVWGEFPDWGIDREAPQATHRIIQEWVEVLERDLNHPAIVGWCPFNETANRKPWPTFETEMLKDVYAVTKAIDPSRPALDASGYVHTNTTDIYDCHNYEQDPVKFKNLFEDFRATGNAWRNHPYADAPYQGQPYFVSEYGGIWWNPKQKDGKSWGYGRRPKSAREFMKRYRGLTEVLLNHPKMFGFCYTQLTDVEQEVNGLHTYQRKPKFDPAAIKAINSQKAAIER